MSNNKTYYTYMQHINEKNLRLRKYLAKIIKQIVDSDNTYSYNKIENEYDIGRGTISRICSEKCDAKISTLWKISEATGIKLSKIISLVEDNLGSEFKLTDE